MRGLSAREAEALCMKEVLTWLKERQLDTCIIETDSMQVIEAMHTSSQNSMFHLLVGDCKYLLRYFRHVQVRFVRRFTNGATHLVAQAARSLPSPAQWFPS